MIESGRTAILSRQNIAFEMQPQTTVFGRRDSTKLQNEPRDTIKPAHKIPSDSRPSEPVDVGFGVLGFDRTDKEVDQ